MKIIHQALNKFIEAMEISAQAKATRILGNSKHIYWS
jgi:hypothetical protein